MCTTAGPHTARTAPSPWRPLRMLAARRSTINPFGFSEETSELMNPNSPPLELMTGRSTRTPRIPTTTRSPALTRCIGTVQASRPRE